MGPTLFVHILAGSAGLISGFVALYAAKGAPLHRRAGLVFVVVMLTMTLTGVVIAAVGGKAPALNIPAGLITAYLVFTGFTTVRPLPPRLRRLDRVATLVALVVGGVEFSFGIQAIGNGGTYGGMPAFPFFLFAILGLLGAVGDLRMRHAGGVLGATRLARHLWRMSFALFIAAMSFFFGQADVIPKPIRVPGLLALPVLAVLVTMLYWVWRVRIRRTFRGVVAAPADYASRSSA